MMRLGTKSGSHPGMCLWTLILIGFGIISGTALAQITFEKTYGGHEDDVAYSVRQTLDSGYIVVGSTESYGAGYRDVYLIKTDAYGETLWTRTFGDIYGEEGFAVEQTEDGGYIVAGYSNGDVYVAKTDSLGSTLWDSTYGGEYGDLGYSMQVTAEGAYVIAGGTQSYGAGLTDVYLIKIDSLGDLLWERTYGGSRDDLARSVHRTSDGGFIITGYSRSSGSGDRDVYLAKTDADGNALWEKTMGGNADDDGMSVQQTSDGGFVIVGHRGSWPNINIYLTKTDISGDVLWEKDYGGAWSEYGTSVQQTLDKGYIVVGYTYSYDIGEGDVYMIKTDSLGNALWERTFGFVYMDKGYCVRQTMDGGYIIAGEYRGEVYLIKTNERGQVGVEEGNLKASTVSSVGLHSQPNPFQRHTAISYSLMAPSDVVLRIHDITGRIVEVLTDETQGKGLHQVQWHPSNKPSGVYFCILRADGLTDAKKLVLIR